MLKNSKKDCVKQRF